MAIETTPDRYPRVHAHIPPSSAFDMEPVDVVDDDWTVLPEVETLEEARTMAYEISVINRTGVVLEWSMAGSDGSVFEEIEDGRLITLPFTNPAMIQMKSQDAAGPATFNIVVRY